MDGSRLLIFMETKRGCDQVTRQLRMDGWPALSIHGDKSQAERDWVLSEFKAGKSPIMTATDVAARGLGMFRQACHVLSRIVDGNSGLFLDAVSSFLCKLPVLCAVLCYLQFMTCICSTKCTDLPGMLEGMITSGLQSVFVCPFAKHVCVNDELNLNYSQSSGVFRVGNIGR